MRNPHFPFTAFNASCCVIRRNSSNEFNTFDMLHHQRFFVVRKCSCPFRCRPHAVADVFMLHAFVVNFCCLFCRLCWLLLIAFCHHSFTRSLAQPLIHLFAHSPIHLFSLYSRLLSSIPLLWSLEVAVAAPVACRSTRCCCCEIRSCCSCCSDSVSLVVVAIHMHSFFVVFILRSFMFFY